MPVRLHHIVIDTRDLPGLARFWTQALGWQVLSDRENEIVIETGKNAPAGMCFMPVTDPETVKNRVHLDLTSRPRTAIRRSTASLRSGRAGPASARPALSPGLSLPTRRETSSASCARRKRSSDEARHREPQTDPIRGRSGRSPRRVAMHIYPGWPARIVGSKLGSRYRRQAEDVSNLHTSGSGPATKFSLGAARGYCRRGPRAPAAGRPPAGRRVPEVWERPGHDVEEPPDLSRRNCEARRGRRTGPPLQWPRPDERPRIGRPSRSRPPSHRGFAAGQRAAGALCSARGAGPPIRDIRPGKVPADRGLGNACPRRR